MIFVGVFGLARPVRRARCSVYAPACSGLLRLGPGEALLSDSWQGTGLTAGLVRAALLLFTFFFNSLHPIILFTLSFIFF